MIEQFKKVIKDDEIKCYTVSPFVIQDTPLEKITKEISNLRQ